MRCLEHVIRDGLSGSYSEEKIEEIIDLLYSDLDSFIGEKISDVRAEMEADSNYFNDDIEDEIRELNVTISELEDELFEIRKYIPNDSLQDYLKLEWIKENWDNLDSLVKKS